MTQDMTADDLLNGYDEELGVGGAQKRDWKGIATALFVISMICLMIGIALVLFTPLTKASHLPKHVNFSEYRQLRYPYGEFLFTTSGDVAMQSREGVEMVANGTHHVIFPRENKDVIPTANLKYYVTMEKIENAAKNPMNHTYFVKIVDAESRISYDVGVHKGSAIQHIVMNENANDFVFVENNQIHYKKSPESDTSIRVSNGDTSTVHGLLDWAYEEEIFNEKAGIWWSDDGGKLAFTSYDNHLTKNVTMTNYQPLQAYPIENNVAYPKTFAKHLPTYFLSIWDKKSEQLKQLDVQLKDSRAYHYLFAVKWVQIRNAQKLVTVWANRNQNEISITICDFESGTCHLEFEYKYASKRWACHDDFSGISLYDNSLYFLLPHDFDVNAFQHIVKLRLSQGKEIAPEFIPFGRFDVQSIVGIDELRGIIFFHANSPIPQRKNLFSYNLKNLKSEAKCLTCSIANCTYSESILSKDFKKAIVKCKGPDSQKTLILEVHNSSEARSLFDEEGYLKKFEELELPISVHDKVKINGDFEALVKLSIPRLVYNREKVKAIPVLVHVYGGPNDQNTKETLNTWMEDYIAMSQHYAVLRIDGRGSGGRGWKYRSPIYGQLGTVEVQDQITAIKQVLKKYSFLDATRVAVHGWSYGGFMSLSMVEQAEENFFKCVISVAPVTNFVYYDATYTERYMGEAPIEAFSDVSKNLDKFRTTKLLLMHGLYDDNVHFQNSAILIDQLQLRNIDFDLMVFPNQDHSMQMRTNFIEQKLAKFLRNCLN